MHTPRSTLAAGAGAAGAALEPPYDAHKRHVLAAAVLHADETPVAMLDPGAGRTKRAYVWAHAGGELDEQRGVIHEFCLGRSSQYPVAFLGTACHRRGARGPRIDSRARTASLAAAPRAPRRRGPRQDGPVGRLRRSRQTILHALRRTARREPAR